MSNGSLIYYVLVYGQVILQLLFYLSIIYLIFGPLRQALDALTVYFKEKSTVSTTAPTDSLERSDSPLENTGTHMD